MSNEGGGGRGQHPHLASDLQRFLALLFDTALLMPFYVTVFSAVYPCALPGIRTMIKLLVWVISRGLYELVSGSLLLCYFLSQVGHLLRNKKPVELCPRMIVDCVCKQTFQCHLYSTACPKVPTAWRVQAAEVCVDMAWRIVAFDLASCTLGNQDLPVCMWCDQWCA